MEVKIEPATLVIMTFFNVTPVLVYLHVNRVVNKMEQQYRKSQENFDKLKASFDRYLSSRPPF